MQPLKNFQDKHASCLLMEKTQFKDQSESNKKVKIDR
jgi:cytoskeletal protein CcmA (bactofilin family)